MNASMLVVPLPERCGDEGCLACVPVMIATMEVGRRARFGGNKVAVDRVRSSIIQKKKILQHRPNIDITMLHFYTYVGFTQGRSDPVKGITHFRS